MNLSNFILYLLDEGCIINRAQPNDTFDYLYNILLIGKFGRLRYCILIKNSQYYISSVKNFNSPPKHLILIENFKI